MIRRHPSVRPTLVSLATWRMAVVMSFTVAPESTDQAYTSTARACAEAPAAIDELITGPPRKRDQVPVEVASSGTGLTTRQTRSAAFETPSSRRIAALSR